MMMGVIVDVNWMDVHRYQLREITMNSISQLERDNYSLSLKGICVKVHKVGSIRRF